ncbi:MAG: PEGA domain-containing protein [Lachnospiraceae bacterium]|nr:PEGA domain-containing protein [Lachnospiraceae bacterium]
MEAKRRKINILFAVLLAAAIVGGCNEAGQMHVSESSQESSKADTGFMLTGPGTYDSADTAIITRIDEEDQTITFFNTTVSKKYTLNYDGATSYSDKYGEPMSLAQIHEGDIVDITFLKSKKRLDTLKLSGECWKAEAIERYEINTTRHDVSIGSDVYKITSDTLIFSEGEQIDWMDLNAADVLTFQGIDTTVYSITVDKGHGYLRLEGDENFIGGWIEVGQTLIKQISEDMLLTVPEGSYQVNISQGSSGGTKSVVIKRNEEFTLNIGDLKVEEPKYGQVVFAVTPSSATLYIDGAKVDTSLPVSLEYGVHQMIAVAPGYSTIKSYFKVASATGGLEVTMEKETAEEEEESSSSSSSTISRFVVRIDGPEGAEVYLNGNYIGVAPVSFGKEAGTHIITLRKSGYETRSYTIEVDSEEKDIAYSFAELTPTTTAIQ